MKNISVVIDSKEAEKINFWVQKSTVEISGLGLVEMGSNGELIVTKAFLLEQENTSSDTEICGKAIAKIEHQVKDEKGTLNFWWHSHVNMGCFWSGQDVTTIKQLGKHGWFLSTVFNKKREYKSAYYQNTNGFLPEVFADNLVTSQRLFVQSVESDEWEKEFKEKCKTKVYTLPNYHGYGGYGTAINIGNTMQDVQDIAEEQTKELDEREKYFKNWPCIEIPESIRLEIYDDFYVEYGWYPLTDISLTRHYRENYEEYFEPDDAAAVAEVTNGTTT